MEPADRATAAAALLAAYDDRLAIEPLSEKYAELTLDDAYEIQQLQLRERLQRGAVLRGHKVGLTSAAMQRQLGVDQPDFGHLLDGMFHSEDSLISIGLYLQPKIEPEVAFVLARPLRGPGVTAEEAADAVEVVMPALEIIDSRIRDWKIGILDTVADNASSGGLVLGSRPLPLSAVDLLHTTCTLEVNGEEVAAGEGSAVMGSPLNALVWLANTLGARGVGLEAGQVVLPGSVTAAFPVSAGDVVVATFTGLGSVTAQFSSHSALEHA